MFAQWGYGMKTVRLRLYRYVRSRGLNRSTQRRCLVAAVFAIFDRAIPKEGD
jgi:hypothetical protein